MKPTTMVVALVLVCALTFAAFVPLVGARSSAPVSPGSTGGALQSNAAVGLPSTVTQLSPILVGPLSPIQGVYDSTNGHVYVTDSNSPYFTNL